MNIYLIFATLIVIGLANGAPILAARFCGEWFACPVDGGGIAADGRPWLGSSKTWRGIVSAYLLAVPMAIVLGFSNSTALIIISLSMCGDLLSSFIKRRRGLVSSSRALGLDQVPEAGLPAVYLWATSSLTWLEAILVVLLFIVVEVLLSKILYRWHIRKQPY